MKWPSLLWLLLTAVQYPPGAPPRDLPREKSPSAAISGRVVDRETGLPVPHASVSLGGVRSKETWIEAVADGEGRYEFSGLEAGEYRLIAGPGEFRATHLRQALGQSVPMEVGGWPPPAGITLRAGERRPDVDIALSRALAIEGRVLDPWDDPMAEVAVVAMRADGTRASAAAVYTDDRGEFRMYGLAPGRYRVCAAPDAPRSSSDQTRIVRTCHLASTAEPSADDVVLSGTDASGIDIRTQRVGTYSVSGSVVDAAGLPVDGAHVSAGRDDRTAGSHAMTAVGRFVLKGLTPGRYRVDSTVGGPANPSDLRPPAREREFGFTFIDVGHGDVDGVSLQLSKPVTIRGRVAFKGSGAPRANRLKMVVQTSSARRASDPFGRPPYSPVDDNLAFELREVYRWPLIVGIHGVPDGWVLQSVRAGGRDITGLPVDLASLGSNRSLEIVLTNRVATPSVRVIDAKGEAVSAANVIVVPADPARWEGSVWSLNRTPSIDGTLKLQPLLPGEYLFAAISGEDYRALIDDPTRIHALAPLARSISLVEGDDRAFDLQLTELPARR